MKSVKIFDQMKRRASIGQLLGLLIACWVFAPSSAYAADAAKSKAAPTKAAPANIRKESASPSSSASGSPFSAGSSSSSSSGGHGLAHEWDPTNELKSYKQNYFLVYALSSQPNNLPTSPNPLNQILIPYTLDNKDVKFQISVKHALADFQQLGAFWFAYTQTSFWQYFDRTNSMPFRENDYEPELIYSLRPNEASILNFGVVHQSNGESNPRSRSWDRVYIKPGIEFSGGGDRRLIVQVRWWQRIPEDIAVDNNPDITEFLGYRELEVRYEQDGAWKVSVIARNRATQLDIAAPLASWLMLSSDNAGKHSADIHLQYFNGYGESLLDYNQSHVTAGIGISFPF
jgi:phospholipase A1